MNLDRLPELPSDLKPLEAELATLAPAGGGMNRVELMYRAGWAACAAAGASANTVMQNNRPGGMAWLWPLTTAGLVLVSATLGIALVIRQPNVEIVYMEKPANRPREAEEAKQPATASKLSARDGRVASADEWLPLRVSVDDRPPIRFGHDYLSLRERVLAFGVDALPPSSTAPSPDASPTTSDSRYGALIGQLRGG